jgi:hypothetical protein
VFSVIAEERSSLSESNNFSSAVKGGAGVSLLLSLLFPAVVELAAVVLAEVVLLVAEDPTGVFDVFAQAVKSIATVNKSTIAIIVFFMILSFHDRFFYYIINFVLCK